MEDDFRIKIYVGGKLVPKRFSRDFAPTVDEAKIRVDGITILCGPTPAGVERIVRSCVANYDDRFSIRDDSESTWLDALSVCAVDKGRLEDLSEAVEILESNVGKVDSNAYGELGVRFPNGEFVEGRALSRGVQKFLSLYGFISTGVFHEKELVCVEFPEGGLHPSWIVEYARILISIAKNVETKFLVATHSPHFVSAIRCISEKEGTLDKVKFYLAKEERVESPYRRFVYRDTETLENGEGKNIEPIMRSFADALDLIYRYSEPEEEK